ncbi:MAG: peptide-methionine (S)-S-oxide reductase MsrA [Planctomycetes bacterium]|nr:peptide-methionine (S)-S-oxide reductase MsrA [Planctomycetota bacterium]
MDNPLRSPIALLLLFLFAACSGGSPPADHSPRQASHAAQQTDRPSSPTDPMASNDPSPSTPSQPQPTPAPAAPATPQTATFGGGCFWCTEAVLEQLDGVLDVTSGYMGGSVEAPTYEQVCTGATGHAEVVQVTFDPARISYETLLDWFFRSHDPTTLNKQGADVGTQYRSVVFAHSPEQLAAAKAKVQQLEKELGKPVVTHLTDATKFWPAEAYHQNYYRGNTRQRYCQYVIAPKLHKLGLDTDPAKAK